MLVGCAHGRVPPMIAPRLAGFRMPAEWAAHERTWMEFPSPNETFWRDDIDDPEVQLHRYRLAWMTVTNAIARFEPVTLICNVGDAPIAQTYLDNAVADNIDIVETPTDDAWFRDSGPTFLLDPDGRLGATHWRFNAWGNAGFSQFTDEQHVGAFAAGLAGAEVFSSSMVNEGGGIHVDGEGTVMVTNTVQLDPERNPGWNAEQVELELKAYLGIERVIWLPRGLTRDYDRFGTRGHVDIIATFCKPGTVLAHRQPNPLHPDHELSERNIEILRAAVDARGRQLEVVTIDAPQRLRDADGEFTDWGYINHYVCNGAVIMCAFDDPNDEPARQTLAAAYPGREIVPIDARLIFECGGGIHCITQQQPASSPNAAG
jgi:agmatine deiminase